MNHLTKFKKNKSEIKNHKILCSIGFYNKRASHARPLIKDVKLATHDIMAAGVQLTADAAVNTDR